MERPEGKYAWTVTVGTKGQIVIPKEAGTICNIHPGDHLLILADAEQGMAIPPKDSFEEYFKKVFH
jgi:AbrB family looped-hinge helix DNA binding protein